MRFKGVRDTVFFMLTKRRKVAEIAKTQVHENDTGSAQTQVALLTRRIEELSVHLAKHLKDKHSRRGLLGLVADRRRHLKYLEKSNKRAYSNVIKKLGLKR